MLPTGTGKTLAFSWVARRLADNGKRTLILAHRSELLDQAAAKLRAYGLEPGLEQAGSNAAGEPVVLASVQSLKGPRLDRLAQEDFRMIVVDEAHHATAPGYRAILDAFPAAQVLGVTATPERLDGAALGDVFDTVAYQYEIAEAISDGWLVPIEALRIQTGAKLGRVRVVNGDFHRGDLDDAYRKPAVVRGVVGPLLELIGERPTIVFASSVAHAAALADEANRHRAGIAVAISGEDENSLRSTTVEEFRESSGPQVLINCELLTEGFDAPRVSCVAIARPTKSRALFAQMVGRGTRLSPEKENLLVLDFVGNTHRHRLVGAADVLAGKDADPEVMEVANATPGNVLEAISQAKVIVTERRRIEKDERDAAWYTERADVLGIDSSVPRSADFASAKQLAWLTKEGLKPPHDLPRACANRLLDEVVRRSNAGEPSFKQLKRLAAFGIEASGLTRDEASEAIEYEIRRRRGDFSNVLGAEAWR